MKKIELIEQLIDVAKTIGSGKVPEFHQNKYFTVGAFDLLIFNNNNQSANFELLKVFCLKYDKMKNDINDLKGFFFVLNQLVLSTGTTEVPNGLKEIILQDPSLSKEIKQWYRL